MTNDDKFTRNAVKVWMRQVLEQKGWTPSEWARRAATTPTNITRVLSPVSEIIPTSATLAKLARAAGSQPNLGAFQRVAARTIPLKALHSMSLQDGLVTIAPFEMSEDAFAVKIQSDSMNMAGINVGDVVFCEPIHRVPPTTNRVVIAQRADGIGLIGRYVDPWLMFQSTTAHNPCPLSELEIVGVCISSIRPVI